MGVKVPAHTRHVFLGSALPRLQDLMDLFLPEIPYVTPTYESV